MQWIYWEVPSHWHYLGKSCPRSLKCLNFRKKTNFGFPLMEGRSIARIHTFRYIMWLSWPIPSGKQKGATPMFFLLPNPSRIQPRKAIPLNCSRFSWGLTDCPLVLCHCLSSAQLHHFFLKPFFALLGHNFCAHLPPLMKGMPPSSQLLKDKHISVSGKEN